MLGRVQGYEVVTYDEKTVGTVVDESENMVVVECGHWPRKSWHALPKRCISVQEPERKVLMQISKEVLSGSPKIAPNQAFDERLVADYYGLEANGA
jgi:hypothetical protein